MGANCGATIIIFLHKRLTKNESDAMVTNEERIKGEGFGSAAYSYPISP